MAHDPIERLDRALVDDPYGPAFDELRAVAGDLLLARGDPRGELIALERALDHGELDRATFMTSALAWLRDHDPHLPQTRLLAPGSVARLELRGGRMSAISLDLRARRLGSETLTEATDALIRALARAPTCRQLRGVEVQIERDDQTELCLDRITLAGRELPLEQLTISSTGRPLGHQTRNAAPELRKHFPHLWLVTRFGRVTPLIEPELLDQPAAWALADFAGARPSRQLRVRIGRGLSSGAERTTEAACELIAALGPAGEVFAEAIELLLGPRVSHAAPWLIDQLPRFGPWARRRLGPRVEQIASEGAPSPDALRGLASRCLQAFDSRP